MAGLEIAGPAWIVPESPGRVAVGPLREIDGSPQAPGLPVLQLP
jgi:hypothetical protein